MPVLRDVAEADLDVFYEQQRDPEAAAMAVFPARDRDAFDAHWRRVLADDSLVTQTIVDEGAVAGNVGCWEQDGRRLVGYWVGREFWGRGLATAALAELVAEIPERPLHAWVATTNVGSIRVLEKCGFVEVAKLTLFASVARRPARPWACSTAGRRRDEERERALQPRAAAGGARPDTRTDHSEGTHEAASHPTSHTRHGDNQAGNGPRQTDPASLTVP